MNPLTADEMACVAREVTGARCMVRNDGRVQILGTKMFAGMVWAPEEYIHQWRALITKISLLIQEIPQTNHRDIFRRRALLEQFNRFIPDGDITALQRMVLELRNPQ